MKRSFVNISNLLTLRYDPTGSIPSTTNLRTINVEEISELRKNSGSFIPSSKDIEDAIRRIIRVKIDQSHINHVSISLSAGVDSNVIFSLIRREFPNLDIDCLTVTFDDSNEALDAKRLAEGQRSWISSDSCTKPIERFAYASEYCKGTKMEYISILLYRKGKVPVKFIVHW